MDEKPLAPNLEQILGVDNTELQKMGISIAEIDPDAGETIKCAIDALASDNKLTLRLEGWGKKPDLDTLTSQGEWTFVSRTSAQRVNARTFSAEFVNYLGIREQVEGLVEHANEAIHPNFTFRKAADRKKWEEENGTKLTEEGKMELRKQGIRRALELLVLTTSIDVNRGLMQESEESLTNAVERIISQDSR